MTGELKLSPGDEFMWTAGNGTVRYGKVISRVPRQGRDDWWFVEIYPDAALFDMTGYRTWFEDSQLIKVER